MRSPACSLRGTALLLSLLPSRPARPRAGTTGRPSVEDLDRLHDHLLRLTGDADVASRATADTALRALGRAADGDLEATTLPRLLRAGRRLAATRTGAQGRRLPSGRTRTVLATPRAGGDATPATLDIVDALATLEADAFTVLDLSMRGRLSDAGIGAVLELRPGTVTGLRERSFANAAALLDDHHGRDRWPAMYESIPVVAAPAGVHRVVAGAAETVGTPGGRRVRPVLAWAGAVAVIVAVAAGLPQVVQQLANGNPEAVAVVTAQPLPDTQPTVDRAMTSVDANSSQLGVGVARGSSSDGTEARDRAVSLQLDAPEDDGDPASEPVPEDATADEDEPQDAGAGQQQPSDPEPQRPTLTDLVPVTP